MNSLEDTRHTGFTIDLDAGIDLSRFEFRRRVAHHTPENGGAATRLEAACALSTGGEKKCA